VRLSTTQPSAATRANTITCTGMPNTLPVKKSRNPVSLITWVFFAEITSANPSAAASVANVMMNGTIGPYAMNNPLTSPHLMPTSNATTTISHQVVFPASSWVATVVDHTEHNATCEPTDRSMPPPMITNVIPMDNTPVTTARVSTVRRFEAVPNRAPAVTIPMMINTTNAMISPRCRPQGLARKLLPRDPPARPGGVGSITLEPIPVGWARSVTVSPEPTVPSGVGVLTPLVLS